MSQIEGDYESHGNYSICKSFCSVPTDFCVTLFATFNVAILDGCTMQN